MVLLSESRGLFLAGAFHGLNLTLFLPFRSAVEAMTHNAGAALVMVVGGKNLISFGVSTAIVPLSNEGKYLELMKILTGVFAGWMVLGVPLYFLMPRYRQYLVNQKAK